MSSPSDLDTSAPLRILTPDQRLRVFVSSTLKELADERRAAREAIERLRLTPVLFELGARPHPPRNLYRAYLAQSQIFVGIYWQRYGWIAPDEPISGLEDEYRLSGDRPKLIYVKRPAPDRDERLAELLDRVQRDDRASYRPFETPDELRDLLENDLALLLTERFEATSGAPLPADLPTPATPQPWPVPATPLIGRQSQIDDLAGLLLLDEVRLVTLLGPGGIGKTRLSIALADRLRDAFADGVTYVRLASVRDPSRVFDSIAAALGLKLEGAADPLESVKAYLRDKDALLVLDNFEQVVVAANRLAELLAAAPRLRLLVTSRTALRLSAEHIHPVAPLSLPGPERGRGEALELFLERARHVRSDLPVDEENLRAIGDIVRRLDGLPLAIELAAARIRMLSPKQLLSRLEKGLDVLAGGARDLPERQRTLRATLDWSFRLLGATERRLFVRAGVFMGGFDLEGMEAVADLPEAEDVLDTLNGLVDHSLIQVLASDGEPRFGMLETVREYAVSKLAEGAGGDPEEVRERHVFHFLAVAERLGVRLTAGQERDLAALVAEGANLRVAIAWALERRRPDLVARFGWSMWLFWWIRNEQEAALPWIEKALTMDPDEREEVLLRTVAGSLFVRRGDAERARAEFDDVLPRVRLWNEPGTEGLIRIGAGLSALAMKEYDVAEHDFSTALEAFSRAGSAWGIAFVRAALARIAVAAGDAVRAVSLTEALLEPTERSGDENTLAWILHVQGLAELALDRPVDSARDLRRSLDLFWRLGNLAGAAHVIGTIAGLTLARGEVERAVRLGGASEGLSEAVGALPFQPERSIFETNMAQAMARAGERAQALEAEGRAMGALEALEYARRSLDEVVARSSR